jgi:hypothetical protein
VILNLVNPTFLLNFCYCINLGNKIYTKGERERDNDLKDMGIFIPLALASSRPTAQIGEVGHREVWEA